MKNLTVEKINQSPIEQQATEFVERKGIGHPDGIADGLAETVSRALSKYYLKKYNRILHHNTDECQIVGGHSKPKFGGGVVLSPAYILLVGRAVSKVHHERLPIRSIAIKSAREYLRRNFKHLDIDSDVMFDCKIGESSAELKSLYESRRMLANDTSFGVGYAPLSEVEKLVLHTEKLINGKLKRTLPEFGEDVKVMGNRKRNQIRLTIAAAQIGSEVPDLNHYISAKEELAEKILDNAGRYTEREVKVEVNTADDLKKNIYYLTVTGLSMENGDDGSTGRGNRVNGLITPHRPMSMEASAGKNPVTHVGKLYNVLAFKLANEILKLANETQEVHVRLLSQIGMPVNQPFSASVQLITDGDVRRIKDDIEAIVKDELDNVSEITDKLVEGKLSVF